MDSRLWQRPRIAGAVVLAVLGLTAFGVERWYVGFQGERQRTMALNQVQTHDEALEHAISRRLASLPALRAFLLAGRPGPNIRDDLDAFAEGLHASIDGIRALQYVRGGVILYTSRRAENRVVYGYNLLADPRPEIRDAVLRAMVSEDIVLFGPIELLQGGQGLVARLSVFPRDDPRFGLVAVVLDLPPIFAEAGIGDTTDGYRKALRDSAGTVLAGSAAVFAAEPVEREIRLPDRNWLLAAVPLGGWAAPGPTAWAIRISLALIVALGSLLALSVTARQAQLRRAVAERTHELSSTNERLASKVSEVELAESALRGQHALLRAVIDGSPDVVEVKDLDGRFVLANDAAARAFERPIADIVGRTPEELFSPEMAKEMRGVERRVLATLAPATHERRARTAEGVRTYLIAVHPWVDATGQAAGTVTVARDVTERQALEAQLRHAQKLDALGRLSGGIAHDFNNILTAILANAHLLGQSLQTTEPELVGEVDEIRAAAQRGAELTRKLLAFGRRDMLERRPLDFRQVVADTAALARRLLPEHIEVTSRLPEEPTPILGDQGALSQVLLNLVMNARDAIPVSGRLEIALAHAQVDGGEVARLVVRDSGTGMDEATRAHVFEPFFTTKPPGAGTGLGLSIAYGLIQQHNGTIAIDSAPGGGTAVTIELPLHESVGEGVAPAPATPAPRGRSETILVVEDEDGIRATIRRLLVRSGYHVLTARNGAEGLEVLRRESGVALVVTDLVMPQMGGAELSQLARQAGVRAPFLFTTGYPAVKHTPEGGVANGAVLLKPWLPEQLLEKVRELLDADSTVPLA